MSLACIVAHHTRWPPPADWKSPTRVAFALGIVKVYVGDVPTTLSLVGPLDEGVPGICSDDHRGQTAFSESASTPDGAVRAGRAVLSPDRMRPSPAPQPRAPRLDRRRARRLPIFKIHRPSETRPELRSAHPHQRHHVGGSCSPPRPPPRREPPTRRGRRAGLRPAPRLSRPREALANCASRVVQARAKRRIDQTSTDLVNGADGFLRTVRRTGCPRPLEARGRRLPDAPPSPPAWPGSGPPEAVLGQRAHIRREVLLGRSPQ
jgi:hypothetical protein